ncbi:hypothetical protein, partial [Bradyrhizobium oligotrophicum]|uniref:hypothetical protein n=1 Tax=Bradyrhizobium oligotrophicum TaxID=44255 RepID=UPI003EBC82D8
KAIRQSLDRGIIHFRQQNGKLAPMGVCLDEVCLRRETPHQTAFVDMPEMPSPTRGEGDVSSSAPAEMF